MRTIGVVTVARSDYGIYLPVLQRIQEDPDLRLHLFVTGMHLSPEFGLTVKDIEADGFEIAERVEMLLSSDTPESIAKSMGLGTIGFGQAYARSRPDILLILGDRFEMHAAAVASVPFLFPIAHIAGGVVTAAAIDDIFRHSITKMSHLHFVETEEYARRVIEMGEEPWRVNVTGSLAVENIRDLRLYSREELAAHCGIVLDPPPLLVTFHPVTREYDRAEVHTRELLSALARVDLPIIFTYPNADTSGRVIKAMIEEFVEHHLRARAIENLGPRAYFSMMHHSVAMVGNSSSGIVEAPSFKLPVVNIGDRQKGRVIAKNVITTGHKCEEISAAISQAISEEFRSELDDLVNPYDQGCASRRIIETLKTVPLNAALLNK